MLGQVSIHDRESRTDGISLIGDIDAKKRFADNMKRQPHHLHRHIKRSVPLNKRFPALHVSKCRFCHQLAKCCDALPMKCRLHQTALAQPGVSLIRKKPIPKKMLQQLIIKNIFVVLKIILLQNIPDMVGVGNEVERPAEQLKPHNIAVFLRQFEKQPPGISAEFWHQFQCQPPSWARGCAASGVASRLALWDIRVRQGKLAFEILSPGSPSRIRSIAAVDYTISTDDHSSMAIVVYPIAAFVDGIYLKKLITFIIRKKRSSVNAWKERDQGSLIVPSHRSKIRMSA